MNTKEYNGWTNYETWLVKLWQDNDQGDQEYWSEQASEFAQRHGINAKWKLADAMKDHYDEMSGDLAGVTGFWADLMGAALSEVNWSEIAQSWLDNVEVEVA